VAEQTPQALAEGMMAFSKVKETFDRNAIQAYAKSFSWNNTVRVLLPFLNKTSRT
jgi:hypothetical protein